MTRFRQLTIEERYQIQIYNALGFSQRSIATTLNRAASTISRELARNVDSTGRMYRAELAQVRTDKVNALKSASFNSIFLASH